ncbi:hypothetical protein, partial [Kerstersia gyiorum]|uniref:hypothetical protein n=1 Tax=Kerstersia gyiorum TaxID=206506 RepID=UPI00209FCD76
ASRAYVSTYLSGHVCSSISGSHSRWVRRTVTVHHQIHTKDLAIEGPRKLSPARTDIGDDAFDGQNIAPLNRFSLGHYRCTNDHTLPFLTPVKEYAQNCLVQQRPGQAGH